MAGKYKIKEVHLRLRSGATVIAEVDSVEDVKRMVSDFADELAKPGKGKKDDGEGATGRKEDESPTDQDSPSSRVEIRAELEPGALAARNIMRFKDDVPQLLRPASLGSLTDAVLVLVLAVEIGLNDNAIDYEKFKNLYESQNIRSGSPLSMLLTNLRNGGYLNKSMYTSDRKLRLTAKGEAKAIEVLKKATQSS